MVVSQRMPFGSMPRGKGWTAIARRTSDNNAFTLRRLRRLALRDPRPSVERMDWRAQQDGPFLVGAVV